MAENFSVFDFALTAEDMEHVRTLDTNESLFLDHRDPAMVTRLSSVKLKI